MEGEVFFAQYLPQIFSSLLFANFAYTAAIMSSEKRSMRLLMVCALGTLAGKHVSLFFSSKLLHSVSQTFFIAASCSIQAAQIR